MSACPDCLFFHSEVVMTRKLNNGWIKRWRRCNHDGCANKWHTYEIPRGAVDPGDADLREIQREAQ